MIKAGVIGTGSIGRHHARIYSEINGVRLTAIADPDREKAIELSKLYNCKAYSDYTEMMDDVDAVSIAVPTTLHHKVAMDFIRREKDILIEKPIASTVEEADSLISEAQKRGLILQVGHLERFNSGVTLISGMAENPRFIESQRLSPFLGRGIDVDVTLDLMIHDIDIILSLVRSEIADIRATGASVLTDNIDIAHAWIEFENGCIAEAVSSRIADSKIRLLKVFQHNAFLNLDYMKQEVSRTVKTAEGAGTDIFKAEDKEPLKEQLISFIDCVTKRKEPVVSGIAGREALKVALKVSELVYSR
ncbi:MAG: Gfo/Idh/MocA family oxidoreductase [Nitrospirae bacterium]|nr:Gfo/Idh/MocA family oxidoreductase [Nitrospirota bacterium]